MTSFFDLRLSSAKLAVVWALATSGLQACASSASPESSLDGGSAGTDGAADSGAHADAGGDASETDSAGDSGGFADAVGDAASDGPAVGDSGAGDSGDTGPVSPACAGKSCGEPCGTGEFPMVCDSQGNCVLGGKCP